MGEGLVLKSASAAETQAIAERLGRLLIAGDVVALIGPLGAGKTTFVQGLARGLDVPPNRNVASPTFALVSEHPGRVPLVHADLYRIEHERELTELGLTDAFDRAAVAIEWLDRFPDAAPADRLHIAIAFAEGDARTLTFTPGGPRATEIVERLR